MTQYNTIEECNPLLNNEAEQYMRIGTFDNAVHIWRGFICTLIHKQFELGMTPVRATCQLVRPERTSTKATYHAHPTSAVQPIILRKAQIPALQLCPASLKASPQT